MHVTPGDLVEHRVHQRGAALEGRAHLGDGAEVAAHRGEGGALADVADVRRGVALEVDRRLGDVGRGDHPADPPSRHRVGLGDAVDDDALVGEVGHHGGHRHEAVRAVREVLVDLVGDHPHAALHRPAPMAATCSGGQTAPDGLSGLTNSSTLVRSVSRRFELLDRDLEAGLLGGVDDLRHAAGEGDRLGVGRPVRRRARSPRRRDRTARRRR